MCAKLERNNVSFTAFNLEIHKLGGKIDGKFRRGASTYNLGQI